MRRFVLALVASLLALSTASTALAAKPVAHCPGGESGFELVAVREDTPDGVDLNGDTMVCQKLMVNFPSTPFGEGPIYNWVDNVVR